MFTLLPIQRSLSTYHTCLPSLITDFLTVFLLLAIRQNDWPQHVRLYLIPQLAVSPSNQSAQPYMLPEVLHIGMTAFPLSFRG